MRGTAGAPGPDRWTTAGSPTAWTPSRRCSSSPRRTPTRPVPTGARPRRSARRRSRSPSSCATGACASCAGSAPGSRRGCASSSRRARSRSWPSSSASSRPALVGLGRYLGLGAKRSVEIARALGCPHAPTSCARRQPPAACGPCRASGRRPRRGSSRRSPARPSRGRSAGCCSTAPGSSWAASRPRSTASRPAMCAAGATRASCWPWSAPRRTRPRVLERFAALPQIVAVIEQDARRAVGVTVDGVPVELVVAAPRPSGPPSCARPARPPTSRRSSRCRTRPTRPPSTGRSACPGARRSCARSRSAASRRTLARAGRHPRRPALPHDVVGRPGERRGDGPRRPRARL